MNTAYQIKSVDGLQLSGQVWTPETKPIAVVCLVHGLGEHCGRYSHIAEAFTKAGIIVIAQDLRGHGKSEGKRGHTPNFNILLDDISQLICHAASVSPDIPLFLYGHSLGGNLVIHYALKKHPKIAGIIASAPLLRLAHEPPVWQQNLLKTLQRMNISAPMPNGLNTSHLSRDPKVVQTYKDDPLNHNRLTPSLAVGMIDAGEWNLKHAGEFSVPLLLSHGRADQITSPKATAEFAAQLGTNCTLKIWDELYHEPHNEPEKDQVIEYMISWLNQHIMH